MNQTQPPPMPPQFAKLKEEIAASIPNFQQRVTEAWTEILAELAVKTKEVIETGPDYVPQVQFSDLGSLSDEQLGTIKRRGCVVIKDIVDDVEAKEWKSDLETLTRENPVQGSPDNDKQFFHLYWTKSQVRARSHPNVLATQKWLNKLYRIKNGTAADEVNLDVPLAYADRFRIRRPGSEWRAFPPHVDGGTIERWQNGAFRACFADILNGNWREHDPYDLAHRISARSDLYGRANQASIFRTFQGWLALSETAPTQGTLRVYPDVLLSNAYLILRPFFRAKSEPVTENPLDGVNWEYDISAPDFPGIYPSNNGYIGPCPTPQSHPHLCLDKAMTSVPKVLPGDMVYWHCDLIHAVETEHTGTGDSSVMYIPAVPYTAQNVAYLQRQRESFIAGASPPDYPKTAGEASFVGCGTETDILSSEGRRAMGFGLSVPV